MISILTLPMAVNTLPLGNALFLLSCLVVGFCFRVTAGGFEKKNVHLYAV